MFPVGRRCPLICFFDSLICRDRHPGGRGLFLLLAWFPRFRGTLVACQSPVVETFPFAEIGFHPIVQFVRRQRPADQITLYQPTPLPA